MLYSMGSALSDREGARPPTVMVHMRSTHLTPEKRAWFVQSVAGKESAIVEMQYEARSGSWQPKNFRWDKSAPNFMTTVIGTLETVRDMPWLADTLTSEQRVRWLRWGEGLRRKAKRSALELTVALLTLTSVPPHRSSTTCSRRICTKRAAGDPVSHHSSNDRRRPLLRLSLRHRRPPPQLPPPLRPRLLPPLRLSLPCPVPAPPAGP